MQRSDTTILTSLLRTALLATLLATAGPARAQTGPDFDTVAWAPIACASGDAAGDEHPASVDLVGDAAYPAAYAAHDASFLYFRYRVDGNPSGPGGFDSYTWAALMQVPSGNPFQYQYELSLFGGNDAVEAWANTQAQNIDFSPLFHDDAEQQVFSQGYTVLTPENDTPLARSLVASDGSAFGGNGDYFVDFAFPISALVVSGIVSGAADLDGALYFPVTSTNPNNYNKGHLDCTFSPTTDLSVAKSVTPTIVPAGATTPLAYTIAVKNDGAAVARGVVIEDPQLPAYLSSAMVSVSSDDPSVTWTVVDTMPLEVRVPNLPAGKTVSVQLAADASPTCGSNGFTNVADAFATNAAETSGSADLDVNFAAGGCAACATDADCDDSNACTSDACVAGACSSTATANCTPCAVDVQCDDGNGCTTDTCTAGVCGSSAPDPTCTPCSVDGDCNDGDACTSDVCSAGACSAAAIPGCGACATDADCDDQDACTTDACTAGTCGHAAIQDCGPTVEDCHDGVDNDGNGATDCADDACADDPGCQSGGGEVCGDCLDNDGDGLVDYEDPDCCAAPMPLQVRRLTLKATAKKRVGTRIRLKAGFSDYTPAGFDPMTGDTTVQISDPSGIVFCQKMPAATWTHRRPTVFRFKDKTGAVAGGLRKSRFKMKNSGAIKFRTAGKQVAVRATGGKNLKVTIGVGGQCSQAMTELRTKKNYVVLP
jgi:uncharacterized repeat protein (TIGR01451 family)